VLHTILEYIKFIFRSTNQYGIHSPFVYELVTKCFYDKQFYKDYKIIAKYRRVLNNNKSVISVKDLGAGSKVLSTRSRKISNISKKAGITKKRAELLYRIVKYFQTTSILELGTSLGISTCALSLGNTNANIITIEGCPETASVAREQFKYFSLYNINLLVNEFDKEINTLTDNNFDLIYIDGNHQKEATINYFHSLLTCTNNDSLIIFDDIHWSKGMTEAWETIILDPNVTLSIDTFYWGFVFFRKEQEKQHFTIRL
jgi:predicted O-methyltransferase YrrM